ncbi:DUF6610 family protein [uncultured Sphingomonas sp.]|uniref:DUF6610 family protein n=1 Tax=uncultured Sphingomonas sp. TaxID=158754 RepID=UPI00338FE106
MIKFVAHGRRVISLALADGWRPGARYTNLRDVQHVAFARVGFLDIDWKNYCFDTHLAAAERSRPFVTVARDIECMSQMDKIFSEASMLQKHATRVIVVPKDPRLADCMHRAIPNEFLLGYSVPTRYGGTTIPPHAFEWSVHLLGGRPDAQRRLADQMPVVSMDCNRFTYDAQYGDYFDGERFRPHPKGGYETCLRDSIANINALWKDYRSPVRD